MNKIEWQLFPKSTCCPKHLLDVINVLESNYAKIDSFKQNNLESNDVLHIISAGLENLGYKVEKSKSSADKIKMPVLFGRNGDIEKYFDVDAYNYNNKTVIEIEAGRGYANHQFLKDLFEAAVMYNVDYCVIAVRKIYRNQSRDFEKVCNFIEALYASNRLRFPFKGLLILGY